MPLLNEVYVAGLTPEQLRTFIMGAAKKFVADPDRFGGRSRNQQPKSLHHRAVCAPGCLLADRSDDGLQLIAIAGGLTDFADIESITIIRAGETGL